MTSANTNTCNIQVINKINVGSDLRMVRAIIRLNMGLARIRLVKSNVRIADMGKLKDNVDNYNLELTSRSSMLNTEGMNLEHLNDVIARNITEASQKVAKKQKESKPEKLSTKTKPLIQKRTSMISSATKWNERQKLEYEELNKTVRKQVREDIRKHNAKLTTEIIQQMNSTKRADKILNI